MISKQIQDAINTQINDELWSAYLYLSMSMDAESKGLRGVANWMFVQWKEEQDHARILQQYMIEQNARVVLQPITEVPTKWNSLASMFKDTLSHEKGVTKSINKIATMAVKWAERHRLCAASLVGRLLRVELEHLAGSLDLEANRRNGADDEGGALNVVQNPCYQISEIGGS